MSDHASSDLEGILRSDYRTADLRDPVAEVRAAPAPASSDLTAIVAAMIRYEGGCEIDHRAGQWHMHEEPFRDIALRLNQVRQSAALRVTDTPRPASSDLVTALRDFVALLPADRWHLLRPETRATVDAALASADKRCAVCAHSMDEHRTPGSECIHARCSCDLAEDIVLASADKTATLDAAWAAAEAALPEGWRFTVTPYWPTGWEAEAHDITRPYTPGRGKHGTGTTGPYDTPAAALLALAECLREERL